MLASYPWEPTNVIVMLPLQLNALAQKIRHSVVGGFLVCAALAGCASSSDPLTTRDPLEPFNREMHKLNRGVDKAVLRPVALGTKGSGKIAARVGDFADNLAKPGDIVNNILQLRLVKAGENTLRFGFNTIFGLGGLFDVATEAGMPENDTDFGETLHIWGVGEGAYVELPLFGPTTGRDLVGSLVDIAIDPLSTLPERESWYARSAKVASKIGDRARYSDTLDSVLYDSADSYAQTRLLYLQNRRYELGIEAATTTEFVDPYEDPYAE
jgi:phospholipid-binding lipoprotein MlaA